MSEDSLTVHILREIREDIRATNYRIDSMERRFDQRFDAIDLRLDRLEDGHAALADQVTSLTDRVTSLTEGQAAMRNQLREVELRLTTKLVDLHDVIHSDLVPRVERCEQDIAGLKDRSG